MRTNTQYFLGGLFLGVVIICGIFTFTQPTPQITQNEKMKECIKAGGEYDIRDWSMRDDGSDYRMTCKIPERKLWQYKF